MGACVAVSYVDLYRWWWVTAAKVHGRLWLVCLTAAAS